MNTALGTNASLFAGELQVWSSGDGTPEFTTYHKTALASRVPSDQDFSGCLELLRGHSVVALSVVAL